VIVSLECSSKSCSFSGHPTHSKQVQPHKVRKIHEVEFQDCINDNDMESAGRRLTTHPKIPLFLINRKCQWTS
jgi:hypothetical protein